MYVAVCEFARSHTKAPASGIINRTVVAGVLACVLSCGAVMPVFAESAPGVGINNLNTEATNYDGSGAIGYDSIAIGDAKAAGGGSVAVGTDALTTGTNAIAIGAGSTATGDGTTREQINAILANNKAIRDGVNTARGEYTISEQDYLRQKEIFDGQNEAVARVNHANELIAGYQAEIDNTLQPNVDSANTAYNVAKDDYDTLFNDFANRIAVIKRIDFSLYANTSTGVVDRDAIAAALKTQTEEGTSFNLPQSFYRTYVDNYISAEGDLRENATVFSTFYSSNSSNSAALSNGSFRTASSGGNSVASYESFKNLASTKDFATFTTSVYSRSSKFGDLYNEVTGKNLNSSLVNQFVQNNYNSSNSFGSITIDLTNGNLTLPTDTAFNTDASSSSGGPKKCAINPKIANYLRTDLAISNLNETLILNDTEYSNQLTQIDNKVNTYRNYNYSSDSNYNDIMNSVNHLVTNNVVGSDVATRISDSLHISDAYLNAYSQLAKKQAELGHEQYLYEHYRDLGNDSEALIHLGNKERIISEYQTLQSNVPDKWVGSRNNALQALKEIQTALFTPVGNWLYNELYVPIHDTNVLLREIENGLDGQLSDKQQALADATQAKEDADRALANKQQQIANATPSQQDLADAAAAEQSAQELQQKKDKLDADKAALEAAKANLVNLETIASDGENAIAIGGNAISTGNAAIGIGADVIVTGENAVGIGKNTIASGKNSVAVGPSNSVAKENGVAVGNNNGVTGMNSIAIGTGNVVSGAGSVAIGNGLNVTEDNVVVLGGKKMTAMADGTVGLNSTDAVTGNQLYQETRFVNVNTEKTEGEGATGTDSVAVGIDSKVTGDLSTSVGNTNTVTGKNSIALGTGHIVLGNNSGAIGDPNIVNGDNSYVVGNNSTVASNIKNAFVMGNSTTVNNGTSTTVGEGVVALGNNINVSLDNKVSNSRSSSSEGAPKVEHVVALGDGAIIGEENTVAIGYTAKAIALNATAVGEDAQATGEGTNAIGHSAKATGHFANALGYQAQALKEGGAAFGQGAVASEKFGTAFGRLTKAQGEGSTAIGNNANAVSQSAVAIGLSSIANGGGNTSSVAIGNGARTGKVDGDGNPTNGYGETIAIGGLSYVENVYASAIGSSANVTGQGGTALGSHASVTAQNAVALGYNAVANEANTVSVGTSSATRKIVNVTDATNAQDASTAGQTGNQLAISGNTLSLKSVTGSTLNSVTLPTGSALHGFSTVFGNTTDGNYNNDGAGNIGAIAIGQNASADPYYSIAIGMGADAGTESSNTHSNIAIGFHADASGAAATAIGSSSSSTGGYAVAVGVGAQANEQGTVALGNRTRADGTSSVALGVDSIAGDDYVVSVGHKSGDYTYGSDLKRRIINVADGTSATNAATVGQTIELVAGDNVTITPDTTATNAIGQKRYKISTTGAAYTAGNGIEISNENAISAKAGTNVTVDNNGINVIGNGTVANGNTGLVSGGTVFNETRVASNGNYIQATNTASQNLVALDNALKNNADALNGKANVALDNITDAGKTVIKTNAKEAINVVGSGKATVNKTDVSGVDTYTVGVTVDGSVANGNTGIVDGGTVYNALIAESRPAQNGNYIRTANTAGANLTALDTAIKNATDGLDGKANVSLNNITDAGKTVIQNATNVVSGDSVITVTPTTENGVKTYTITASVNPDGAIAEGNTGLVSGGAVYNEVRPTNGNYVEKVKTTAENLTALDNAIKNATDGLNGKANVALDNITDAGHTVIKTDAKASINVVGGNYATVDKTDVNGVDTYTVNVATDGAVADGNTKLVTGDTVYDALQTQKTEIDTALDNKANKDASNVSSYASEWGTAIGTGTVNASDGKLVTGATVAGETRVASNGNYIQASNTAGQNLVALDNALKNNADALDGKANVSLNNVTDAGHTVIKIDAKSAINVAGNEDVSVNKTDVNGVDTYNLSVVKDGAVASGEEKLVTGGTVYDALQVETRPASDGNYIHANDTAGTNLTALDTQVKANADAIDDLGDSKANTTLNNITNEGKTVVKNLAKEAVKVVNGTNTTVTEGTDGDAKTYAVNVIVDGQVADGNTGIVDGGTVYDALQDMKTDIDTDLASKANKDASNVADKTAEWGTAIGTGAVASGNGELVTGGIVYNALQAESRPASNGNYITTDNTAGANLTVLDAQVKTNADAITNLTDKKANISLNNITEAGRTVIQKATNVVSGDSIISVTPSIAEGVKTYTISANISADGQVASGNTGLVSGGTVYSEVRPDDGNYVAKNNTTAENLTALDTAVDNNEKAIDALDGLAVKYDDTTKSKITLSGVSGSTIDNVADGTLATDSKEAVNGSQLYTTNQNLAQEITDRTNADTALSERIGTLASNGEYITTTNNVSQNLSALDSAISDNKDSIEQINTDLTGKANVTLNNITNPGKTVVRDLAKEAVKVVDGINTTVTEGEDGVAKTYVVNVTVDGQIAENNTGIVDGGTVYEALKDQKDEITDALDTKANKDASNVADQTAKWGEAIGTGTVASGNGELVTGGTVFDALQAETRPASNGNYIAKDNTAGANLSALDEALKGVSDIANEAKDGLDGKANTGLDNITDSGKTVIRDLAKSAVKVVNGTNTTVTEGEDGDAKTYAVNVTTDGVVESGNRGIVTGDTVYNETRITNDGEYVEASKSAAENIQALDDALKGMSDGAVTYDDTTKKFSNGGTEVTDITMTGKVTAGTGEIGGLTINNKKISGLANGRVNATSTEAINGSQLYTTNQNLAQEVTDRTNADTALSERIGTLASDGNYITVANNVSQNLSALDTAIKSNEDAIGQINTDLTGKANIALDNIDEAGHTVIKTDAKSAINVAGNEDVTVSKTDVNGVDTYNVAIVKDGAIASGEEKVVTGGAVYDALVAETRPAQDGNYIVKDGTAGENLTALDEAVKANEDAIATNAGDITNLKNLSNITEAGETVIKNLAKGSVNVVGVDKATVTKSDVNGVDTYTVSVKADGQVAQGDTNIVSGDTVYQSLQTERATTNTALDGKANVGLDNITDDGHTVIKTDAKASINVTGGNYATVDKADVNGVDTYIVNVATDGAIAQGDTKLVTGGTVYEAIQARDQALTDDLNNKANKDASNVADYATEWGTAIGSGKVEANDGKLVTGDTVFKALQTESRPASDGNYILKDNTAGENLTVLDTQVKANADAIATNTGDITDLKNLSNITEAGKTVIKNLAKGSVNVVGSGKANVTKTDVNGVDTYTVDVQANGEIEDNNKDIVNGGTVFNAIKAVAGNIIDYTDAVLEGKANVKLDNITNEGHNVIKTDAKSAINVTGDTDALVTKTDVDGVDTYAISISKNGAVAQGNEEIVTGGTVYDALQGQRNEINTVLDTKANIDLDNITDNGKTVVRNLAKESVKVISGSEYVTVTEGTDGNAKTYAVDVLANGAVESGNTGLVTGNTVFDEVRVENDGNYVLKSNTAGQNITELDKVLKETRDIAEAAALTGTDANAVHYDGTDKSTVTLAGAEGTLLTNLKDGDISATSTDAVTGKQLFETNERIGQVETRVDTLETTVGTMTDGNYIGADKSVGENLSVLDSELKNVSDGLNTVTNDIGELRDNLDGKLNTNMDNLTSDGESVISTIAKNAVKVEGTGLATVTSAEKDNAMVYTVDVQANGKVEEGNTDLVNGETVYDAVQGAKDYADGLNTETRDYVTEKLEDKADTDLGNITEAGKEKIRETMKDDLDKKANVDASNINPDVWAEKLGVGEVADGNTGLVNGGTVFKALQDIEDSAVVKADFDAGVIRVGGTPKYDEIGVMDISNSQGEGRVLTGVVTDPSDANSAANVGYVNAVGENIIGNVNAGFNRMDAKINKVGANAAAMASLSPIPNEDDTKWNIAAAVGNYKDATAGAVGVFYKPAENVMLNVRGSFGNDENMVGGGVTFALSKSEIPGVTKATLAKAVNTQAQHIKELESNNQQLQQDNEAMRQMMMQMQERLEKLEKSSK